MTYRKKLIEVALPLEDINREAAREKSIRHGHPSTLHLWWARRPLAACRAVLFASLVDDPSECVAELMADKAKRKAAEGELQKRQKLWATAKTLLSKAQAAGISAPEPGPEPKVEAILVETERERLFGIIRELVKWENSTNGRVIEPAKEEILRSCKGSPPPIYDPFCGGGSIPLEAQRLGLEAHASDLNPVPVLINKALIEIPPKFAAQEPVHPGPKERTRYERAEGLAEDVLFYGKWIRAETQKLIGDYYPQVRLPKEQGGGQATVIAWLWARTVASPNPAAKGAHVPLVRSFWLSTKSGKNAWSEPVVDRGTMTFRFEVRTGIPHDEAAISAGTKTARGANFRCILTDSPIHSAYIKTEAQAGRLGIRLIAIVAQGGSGRVYLAPDQAHESIAGAAKPSWKPDGDMPENPRWFSPPEFGLSRFSDIFTNRQLLLLSTLCDQIAKVRLQVENDQSGKMSSLIAKDYAVAVCTYLGLGISKVADYNSSLVLWSQARDQAKTTFTRHALPMVWDFAEVNPFAEAAGDISISLEGISKTLLRLPAGPAAHVLQSSATNIASAKPLVFSTDPPYYDNIGYADLSDFFYVWLRHSLETIHPSLLGTMLVPKREELVATPYRFDGDGEAAKTFFENGLSRVFRKIYEQQSREFPLTVFYAFKQTEEEEVDSAEVGDVSSRISTGWETILQSLVSEGFQIDGTWPIRTERGVRTVGLGTNALASSIVLVCRPRPKDAGVASRRDFLTALKRELPEAVRNLQKGNIAPVDLAQAAIGPGMAVFSRFARVIETDGSPMGVGVALALINHALDEVLAEQEGEFDADTRWALAWFEQNGFNEGLYGVAEILCTAKNTSVAGMTEAGILAAKAGKVRLLRRDELPADWDPSKDKRLTIWESTHQLIRALDAGEEKAADLLRKLGTHAEAARDLSYRLYSICERRKWSHDALGYNSLVQSWSDVKRVSDEQKPLQPVQQEFL